jgi:hypothetical protein
LRRQTGLSGIAVALLFGAGSALWVRDMPDPGAPAGEVADFYRKASARIVAGAGTSLLAVAVFVFFASGLRRVLSEAEGDDLLGTTAFGGALMGAGAGLGAETINMVGALRARDGRLTDELAQALFQVSQVLGFNAAGVGVGTMGLSTAAVAIRTGTILPRWLAVITLVVGAALLTPLSRVVLGPGIALLATIGAWLAMSSPPKRGLRHRF